jgi:transcriptional regulator with XRE-family HTH domain
MEEKRVSRKSGQPGPAIDKRKLSVLGQYLLMALDLSGISTMSELSRRSGIDVSVIGKLMKNQTTVKSDTLFRLCDAMECPEWLEDYIATAAGYSSRKRQQLVADETTIREVEKRVHEEIQLRTATQNEPDPG